MTSYLDDPIYSQQLLQHLLLAKRVGATTQLDYLQKAAGADPIIVKELFARHPDKLGAFPPELGIPTSPRLVNHDHSPAEFVQLLPAPDPLAAQWWFCRDTIIDLAYQVRARSGDGRVLFLGTPTLALWFGSIHNPSAGNHCLHDVDSDIISAVEGAKRPKLSARIHDVAIPLPPEFGETFDAVVADPPWYDPSAEAFLEHAAFSLCVGGWLAISTPKLLTRPSASIDRQRLLRRCEALGFSAPTDEFTATYGVPPFERSVLSAQIGDYTALNWRQADILFFQKVSKTPSAPRAITPPYQIETYSIDPRRFRVFFRPTSLPTGPVFALAPEFEAHLSGSKFDASTFCVWTSERRAARVRDPRVVRAALEMWAHGKDKAAFLKEYAQRFDPDDLSEIAAGVESMGIWGENSRSTLPRSAAQIRDLKGRVLSDFACQPEGPTKTADIYRDVFQRDRDRILWSHGFRALASKTQVFPVEHDDHLRQRLAHSIEVMQLASTIGASFGLDRDLIEAGALAHDIGHTPFGHAGESALKQLFDAVCPSLQGFNHYEHGVDVVRYLETAYASGSIDRHPGLDVSSAVMEAILKHTFCRQGPHLSEEEVMRHSKHTDLIPNRTCHLEGQAIRLADKLSYLVSDLEDGIRMGVISAEDLHSCRLFRRPEIDLFIDESRTLLERFIKQRRFLLKTLMEDAIEETARRLRRTKALAGSSDYTKEYTVFHSRSIELDLNEVWNRLQSGRLHRDRRVVRANLRASMVVTRLTIAFAVIPDLVPSAFFQAHRQLGSSAYMQIYRERANTATLPIDHGVVHDVCNALGQIRTGAGIALENLILAKDYVASLTDSRARALYEDLFGSSRFIHPG